MLVVVLENSHRHPNGTKIIARKIGSFLGAEANKSKDEHEEDSLISGSGLKLRQIKRSEWPKVKKISHSSEAAPQTGEM